MENTDNELILDMTKLREQRRPLWMSSLGIDHVADMIGGGGDLWTDRLTPEWPRNAGEELTEEEAQSFSEEVSQAGEFPPQSERAANLEEAFMYVHKEEEEPVSASAESETPETQKKKPAGLGAKVGVGLKADVKLS